VLQNGSDLSHNLTVEVIDEKADQKDIVKLNEPSRYVSVQTDGVSFVPFPDDRVSEDSSYIVGRFLCVKVDRDVAEKFSQGHQSSQNCSHVDELLLVKIHKAVWMEILLC